MNKGLVPKPSSKVKLKDYDPDDTGGYEQDAVRAEKGSLAQRLEMFQERLYAEGNQSLLVVLQAMDAGGKDGTIRKVFDAMNPQGVKVVSFKQPSSEELAHDFLWRVHHRVPAKGYIGIFNRSHYEDVLVVRVNNLVPESVWKKRYEQINQFERLLSESGTRILKFFLHISKHEQKKRFQARLDDPEKHWKFSMGDLPVRQQWDEYMAAYEAALSLCNTDYAPWHIVPANHKWYRNLIISRAIVGALEDMNPQFPAPEAGLEDVVIPN